MLGRGKISGLHEDDVKETVEAMGALARQCKNFYTHMWRSEEDEDARVRRIFAAIRDLVEPAIPEPVTETLTKTWTARLRRG